MSTALYYPWIDIKNEAWLKSSILYWDNIRTIVPESIDSPYKSNSSRSLADIEFLVPLRVTSEMDEIEKLTGDVLAYLDSAEAAELIAGTHAGNMHNIHVEKLPHMIGRFANMHPEKLPTEIRYLLRDRISRSERDSEWMRVDEGFANFYMTLLANQLSERIGASLLTPLPSADKLAISRRFDAQLNRIIPTSMNRPRRHWREYEAFGERHHVPRQLAPGMLATLAIDQIEIDPETPIEQLIRFKEKHKDELLRFRTKIEQLAASVETDLPMEALRQKTSDLYTSDVIPAITNLKAALKGQRIKWLSTGLFKVAFLSAGSSAMLVTAGLSIPAALLAGAGISFMTTGAMYNVEKEDSIRANPYAYLLSLKRGFS